MQLLTLFVDLLGIVSFALSGAMTALRKDMDVFGVCVLGLTTATGGGVIRDLILGIVPPTIFVHPNQAMIALGASLLAFVVFVRFPKLQNNRVYDRLLLLSDSIGLGVFVTVYGVKVAMDAGYAGQSYLILFISVLTGVGGGVMRDIFAGDRPYIFVKHIYALAGLAGAAACLLLWDMTSPDVAMVCGAALVIVLRLLSAKFRWNLPTAKGRMQ